MIQKIRNVQTALLIYTSYLSIYRISLNESDEAERRVSALCSGPLAKITCDKLFNNDYAVYYVGVLKMLRTWSERFTIHPIKIIPERFRILVTLNILKRHLYSICETV